MANGRFGRFIVARPLALLGLLGLAVATLGCGDDGNNLAEFVGTWKYTNTGVTFACPNQADTPISLGNQKTFHLGIKSDLVDLSSICDYRFDVSDKVAAIQKLQTCQFDDGSGNGTNATEAPTSWTFTLNSATTAEEKLTTATTFIDGTICTIDGVAHLEKISKD